MEQLQHELSERLVKEIFQAIYDGINNAMEEDPVGDKLFRQLIEHLSEALGTEIQTSKHCKKFSPYLLTCLEEIKVNYVENLSEEDLEEIFGTNKSYP